MTAPPAASTGHGSVVPVLYLDGVSRSFGAVRALDGASLVVRPGTVHALLGENGAGKTTLMRIVFGLLAPDRGRLLWKGRPLSVSSPADALRTGIGMVHQHFTLVPAMTVAENVSLGGQGNFDPQRAAARVREVATRAGLQLDADARVDTLPVGAQQRCEIVKALARDVQLLILDEPTAVLAPSEAAELLAWIRRFADAGNAVVLITHKLRDALAVADDVTVLHRGRTVYTALARETNEERLASEMLGGERGEQRKHEQRKHEQRKHEQREHEQREHEGRQHEGRQHEGRGGGGAVLSLAGVSWTDARGVVRVRDASLDVRRGEIVGIAAVEGAGQHELLRLLAGRLDGYSGRIERPAQVGFVPEDRHRDALLLEAPLYENAALHRAGAREGRMPWSALRESTAALLARFDVRAPGPQVAARTLSGGNQQKFVLGRELAERPEALVVENPSRGLDFKATAAVQQALRDARDDGTAVVLYSSDLDEVLLLADRVYVMHAGAAHEVRAERDVVGRAMLGGVT